MALRIIHALSVHRLTHNDIFPAYWTSESRPQADGAGRAALDRRTRDQLELLGSDQRDVVQAFIASGTLPDDASRDFIDAVAQVLSGLSKVVVTTEELRRALFPSGSPATPSELKKRFGGYVDDRAKGMDEAKVRIVIE